MAKVSSSRETDEFNSQTFEGDVTALPEGENEIKPADPESVVIIFKRKDSAGNISTVVSHQGVEATEVQTLIELGLLSWRKQIGLQ